jgi:hypothetical protein
MSFIEQLSAIALLIDFLFGVTFGVVGSASLASRREDREYSLVHAPPDPLCDGVRMIQGVYTRGDSWVSDARRAAALGGNGRPGGNDGPGSQGQETER